MIEARTTDCLDAETLAAFAEGTLKRHEIPAVLAHLEGCARCMHALETANALREPASSRKGVPWLAVAAAMLIAVGGAIVAWRAFSPRDTASLAALVPHDGRNVEPRLTGGFAWAPYRGPMRANDSAPDATQLRLAGAAGEILERAKKDHSPRAQHAAGAALLLIEQPLDAATKLRAATARAPSDASLWSDLAAAEYASAVRFDRASLYAEALAAADQALKIRPELPEALFNRALTLERMGLPAQAREAWQRYLGVDASSPWANEARAHLQKLSAIPRESLFRNEQPRLERAAIAGDAQTVAAIVRAHPQSARTWAEAEYLGHWGEAVQRGDAADAARNLTIARAIGVALQLTSGEALLAEAVRAIDSARDPTTLAEAHVVYRRGRITYSRQLPTAAEKDLRHAAALFASANDTMSLVARYFAANTRVDQNDVDVAYRELDALREEVDAQPRFTALAAQIRWELALCLLQQDDCAAAIPLLSEAEERFRKLGERAYHGFVLVLLADAYLYAGRPDDAWAARIQAFRTVSDEDRPDLLSAAFNGTVFTELRSGRIAAARSLLQLHRGVLRESANNLLLTLALVREALLGAGDGDTPTAWARVREATAVAERFKDEAMRERARTDVAFAKGAVLLRDDPAQARTLLSAAIEGYGRAGAQLFLAECHLLRARAALRMNDRDAAQRDLDAGIGICERHRIRFAGSVAGTGVLDAGPALYRESIRLAADRGNPAAVFLAAERFFAQIAPDRALPAPRLAALQQRLAGTGTTVLEIVVLPNEVVSLAINANDATIARSPVADLHSLDDARLYDVLIRPATAQLRQRLIVIADPLLSAVSFAALYDANTKQRLIERLPVATALSANTLQRIARPQPSMAAIELSAGDAPALPAAREEIAQIGRLYPHAETLDTFPALIAASSRAGVLHIAGHTQKQSRTGESVLVFGGERVSWQRAAAAALEGAPIVILAACETLRAPHTPRLRSLSLGAGFLAAGAGDVIGTLAPIPDNDARALFAGVHRHLAAGRDAAEALRLAQLEAIADETDGRHSAWRDVALLTNRL